MKAIIAAIGLTITVTTSTLLALPLPASAGKKDICSNANIQRNLFRSAALDQGWHTNNLLGAWKEKLTTVGFYDEKKKRPVGVLVTECFSNSDGTHNVMILDMNPRATRRLLKLEHYRLMK
jgi:hypothetical protein